MPRRSEGAPCCATDEGGPLGAVLQEKAPNRHERLPPNGDGRERHGQKAGENRVRYGRKRRTQVNLRRSIETSRLTSKPGSRYHPGTRARKATCLLSAWRPVCRRRDLRPGCCTELGNLSVDVKGKGASGENHEAKIPMRQTGADRFVVVRKIL